MSEEVEPHILKKYELQQRLGKYFNASYIQIGKGAYGIVWKAIDLRTKKVVALKKIFDAF